MSGFRRDAQGAALLGGAHIAHLLTSSGLAPPAYLYDLDAMGQEAQALHAAFGSQPHLIAYALKANSAGSVVRALAGADAGADVVSGAELELALAAGIPADRIVMSGVAKSDAELDQAIGLGLLAIQLESTEEIARVAARARALGARVPIALRVNPGIEIDSHAHVATGHDAAKFGILTADLGAAHQALDAAADALVQVGLSTHVGSMMKSPEPYARAARLLSDLAKARKSSAPALAYLSFGGGFGIDYGDGPSAPPAAFVEAARAEVARAGLGRLQIVVEPGRALVAAHGVLVARVIQTKISGTHRFLLIDAGMNDLLRPALYAAPHRIEPVDFAPGATEWRVVGPVCESADDFGSHPIGDRVPELVVIRDAGAYGFTMASEYNGRPLPAEISVSGGRVVTASPSPGRAAWVARRLLA